MTTDRNARGQFVPGSNGNPHGRPKGSRNQLSEAFIRDLEADWQEHGIEVVRRVRVQEPAKYMQIVASLVPKDVHVNVSAAEKFGAIIEAIETGQTAQMASWSGVESGVGDQGPSDMPVLTTRYAKS